MSENNQLQANQSPQKPSNFNFQNTGVLKDSQGKEVGDFKV